MITFKQTSDLFWNTIKSILRWFGFYYASGHLTIVCGEGKTIKILTGFTPKRVWIYPHSPCGTPICGGSNDSFDIFIIPDGFVLNVKLQSESRDFDWIAER